ncbi:MAG TPA: hypothetical protein H9671_01325 [Firmicutes bacterium]|nr:hypothetical protein [Bacillota bacterium]
MKQRFCNIFNPQRRQNGLIALTAVLFCVAFTGILVACTPEKEDNGHYTVTVQENGDVQVAFTDMGQFPALTEENEGAAYWERETNSLHVEIITGLGQPSSDEAEGPVGSLAGAQAKFDAEMPSGEITQSELIPAPDGETILDLDEAQMKEIALYLFKKIQNEIPKESYTLTILKEDWQLSFTNLGWVPEFSLYNEGTGYWEKGKKHLSCAYGCREWAGFFQRDIGTRWCSDRR